MELVIFLSWNHHNTPTADRHWIGHLLHPEDNYGNAVNAGNGWYSCQLPTRGLHNVFSKVEFQNVIFNFHAALNIFSKRGKSRIPKYFLKCNFHAALQGVRNVCPKIILHLTDSIRIALYISKKNYLYISYVYCFLIFVEFPTLQMYTELHQPPKGYFKPHGQNILKGYFKPHRSDRFC